MSELTRDSALEFLADYITNNEINYAGGEFEREDNKERFLLVVSKESALKNLTEENQRLTAMATKHATINDERYELLLKQKSDIEMMLDQLFKHEKVDGWLVCKMNDMLDDVNHQLDKSRIEAEQDNG